MITKAIITELPKDNNEYKVRIPFLEDNTGTEMIFTAYLCDTPNIYSSYKLNDVVYVIFEDNKKDIPVIMGKLFVDKSDDSNSEAIFNELTIKNKINLPTETSVGKYSISDIFGLQQKVSSKTDNLQQQIDSIKEDIISYRVVGEW
jgi:hypothetical protein